MTNATSDFVNRQAIAPIEITIISVLLRFHSKTLFDFPIFLSTTLLDYPASYLD